MQNNNALNIIHPNAKIGKNVHVSPFVTIEDNVVIGDDCWIGPNACILSGVRIGNNCKVFPGAVVGAAPQDLKFGGEESILNIGNNVVIREYCTINRGTKANFKTEIKDNCLLMAYVHVAHDCVLENNVILANNVTLAGHIEIGEFAVIGGMTAIHQFVKIGKHAMVGGGSLVRKCVPPYVKAAREPLSYVGVNSTGLRRRGFSNEQINHIQDIYRVIFVKKLNVAHALNVIELEFPGGPEKEDILSFIKDADRGLMKGFQQVHSHNNNGSRTQSNF